jgi:protein tyrosine/serine phosphatase
MPRQTPISFTAGLIAALTVGVYPAHASNNAEATLLQARIRNFDEVSPQIWRGSAPSDLALEDLAKHGVKTIVDLRLDGADVEHEHVYAHRLGVKYVHIPLGYKKPSENQIVQFLNVVNDQDNLPAYVHCRQGADRTGTVIGIYRTLMQGWNFDKVYAEMRDHHFKPFLVNLKKSVASFAANRQASIDLPGLIDYTSASQQANLGLLAHTENNHE